MAGSIPIGVDPAKAEAEMRRIDQAIRDFRALPEVDRLKYYLANAYQALKKIADGTGVDLRDDLPYSPMWNKYAAKIAGAICTADLACCHIPDEYRTTEITIG